MQQPCELFGRLLAVSGYRQGDLPTDSAGTPRFSLMLVISWNVKAFKGIKPERLEACCTALAEVEPDLVLLQEVSVERSVRQRVAEALAERGLEYFVPPPDSARGKGYGSAIASAWPLRPAEPGWAEGAPWPQLLCRATLERKSMSVDVVSVQVPNGTQNGWKKIETLEVLGGVLRHAPDHPRLVAGDLNEPKSVVAGAILPFAQKHTSDGRIDPRGRKRHKKSGIEHPRARWDLAVRSVLDAEHWTGLRHAYLSLNGSDSVPVTHRVKGKPRFFDHLLVSRHFEIEEAGYRNDWMSKSLSDHAAAWARVNLREGA